MTTKTAIKKLIEQQEITTGIIEALNISMDTFLAYCQRPKAERQDLVKRLIIAYTA